MAGRKKTMEVEIAAKVGTTRLGDSVEEEDLVGVDGCLIPFGFMES